MFAKIKAFIPDKWKNDMCATLLLVRSLRTIVACRKKYKGAWIISERLDEAKDNGFYFFKYIRKNHPEQKVFYAIKKDSKYYSEVLKVGPVVEFGSIEHYAASLLADVDVTSFILPAFRDNIWIEKRKKKGTLKSVYLKHGVMSSLYIAAYYSNTHFDLISSVGESEYEMSLKTLGYPHENMANVGLCRYDGLINCVDESHRFILIMPTYRNYARKENLSSSSYLRTWMEFVNSDEFSRLSVDFEVYYFLHDIYKNDLNVFLSSNCGSVKFVTSEDVDCQELMRKASIMITDYSSVSFDFAYMNKPLMYYQFDEEDYYSNHHIKSNYDYETMGFGPKCCDDNQLLEELEAIIANDCINSQKYQERSSKFFKYHDSNNCARTYDAIRSLLESGRD